VGSGLFGVGAGIWVTGMYALVASKVPNGKAGMIQGVNSLLYAAGGSIGAVPGNLHRDLEAHIPIPQSPRRVVMPTG